MSFSRPEDLEGPRACGPYELAGVLDLANFVMRTMETPKGQPPRRPSIGFDYPHVFNPHNLDNIRIVVHRGRVVCSVGIYSTIVRTPRGEISVGGICCLATHPDYRRLGLATQIMEDAHKRMQSSGNHIGLLSTLIDDFYRKLGWETAGRQRLFTFDRGNVRFLPGGDDLELTEDWQSRAKELNLLHLEEPINSPRSDERFHLLMERKAERVFVGLRKGKAAAYVSVKGHLVKEYGGKLEDAGALLKAVFAELDSPDISTTERLAGQRATIEMQVQTPDTLDGLPGFLLQSGVPSHFQGMGMIKLIDVERLFEALQLSQIQATRADQMWHLSNREVEQTLAERELVKLLFGPERGHDFSPDHLPLDFYQWPSDRV